MEQIRQIWKSGPWDGQTFILVPDMHHNSYSLFKFTFVFNENETSFSYYVIQTPYFISKIFIDYSGQFQLFTWLEKTNKWSLICSVPKQQCEVSDVCGAYGICNQLVLPPCNCRLPSRVGLRKFGAWEITLVVVSETSSWSVVKQMYPMARKRCLENIPSYLLGKLQDANPFACVTVLAGLILTMMVPVLLGK